MSEVVIKENLFTKDFDADFVLNKWVPALRSGEFEQGKRAIKQVDPLGNATYCCIGVACELAELPMVKLTGTKRKGFTKFVPDEFDVYAIKGDAETGVSEKLAKKIGLVDSFGEFRESESTCGAMLTTLNDEGDFTFNDIADIIESHAKARLAEKK